MTNYYLDRDAYEELSLWKGDKEAGELVASRHHFDDETWTLLLRGVGLIAHPCREDVATATDAVRSGYSAHWKTVSEVLHRELEALRYDVQWWANRARELEQDAAQRDVIEDERVWLRTELEGVSERAEKAEKSAADRLDQIGKLIRRVETEGTRRRNAHARAETYREQLRLIDCGHGYRLTDSCPSCDVAEADEPRSTVPVLICGDDRGWGRCVRAGRHTGSHENEGFVWGDDE